MKNKLYLLSIANQLRYGLVTMVALAVVVTGSLLTFLSFRTIENQAQQLQQQQAKLAEQEISNYLNNLQRQLTYLSQLKGLTDFPSTTQKSILESLIKNNSTYEVVGLLNKQGEIIQAISPYTSLNSFRFPFPQKIKESELFKRTFNQGDRYISPIIIDSKTKLPLTFLAVPIRDRQNQIAGVLFAQANLNFLDLAIASKTIGKTGYTYIFDENLTLIAQSGKNLQRQSLKTLKNLPFIQKLSQLSISLDKPSSIIYQGLEGKKVLGTATRVRQVQWTIVIELPTQEVYQPVRLMLLVMGGVVLICIVVGVSLGFTFAKSLIVPLQKLTKSAVKISEGELESRVDIKSNNELGTLANAFNKMGEELKISYATLATQNSQLKRLDRLKDDFLANTSHELRTPLHGIIGLAESMLEGTTEELDELQRKNLLAIIQSGRRLNNLVNDILDFSKLRHQDLELQLKSLSLREMVEVIIFLNNPLIRNKNLALVNSIPLELPPVQADENRLQQILYNLIGNGIKFTPSGTVEIDARVSLETEKMLEITVKDTGIGIPETQFESIFESFEQGDSSTAREYGGTGLGLAIVKKLVELHGGQIWLKSTVGVGSQFTFTLPMADPQAEILFPLCPLQKNEHLTEASEDHLSLNLPTEKNGEKITVLIVDDEPINLQVLVNNLSLHNYTIVQANNGEEALAIVENGLKPDLVLLDVMMPKLTGYEVTKRLRDRFSPTELPILLLTAKNQVEDLVIGFDVGANDYLNKPIAKDELLARMRTQLNLKFLREENLRILQDYNYQLAQEVAERTQELSQTLDELRATQNELIQSEKMAALGQLVASVAHEINNPLGVIQASLDNLTISSQEIQQQLPQLLQQLDHPTQILSLNWLKYCQLEPPILGTKEERQLRRNLQKQLENIEIPDAENLASILAPMGFNLEDLTPFLSLFKSNSSALIITLSYKYFSQNRNLRNIKIAVTRASKIIFALKYYTGSVSTGGRVKINLAESIDLTLNNYHSFTLKAIKIIKNYGNDPVTILGNPEELSQVWNNLIYNAFQGMNFQGSLKIDITTELDLVIVKITDFGTGISPEIKSQIFAPFFTTKPLGEGSGLGLYIVDKIINKHFGTIAVDSQPGQTTFTICLPREVH